MCNIAGYVGERQAAPILIEMLRKQQIYDGGFSTGVATVHEGKLYYRKVVGDVDTLLRETDALSLPGTIGIAHTRPAGDKNLPHPYVSMDGRMAVVTNGNTPRNHYSYLTDNVIALLEENGYKFSTEMPYPKEGFPSLSNGHAVSPAEARVHLTDYFVKQGDSLEHAMARCSTDMYADNVFLALSADCPDSISAVRTTRPMYILPAEDGMYMATTGYGFPEDAHGERISLPLRHVCRVARDGVHITNEKLVGEKVCEITPAVLAEAASRFEKLLTGKKDAPLHFGDFENEIHKTMRDIWDEEHTYSQAARLAYEVIELFEAQGKLKSELRDQKSGELTRKLRYMWID